ncbi:MAG TPA: FHA domain-containing protein [Candidatus Binatia bacterium]|nr:FHA domain-containing protein [Candidatus Binatia bacterium]
MWNIVIRDAQGRTVAERELAAGSLSIGRDAARDLVLPSKAASRRHARVELKRGAPQIVDEGSANGVLVDGARIAGPTALTETSRVEIAEFSLSVQRQAPPKPAPPPKPARPPEPVEPDLRLVPPGADLPPPPAPPPPSQAPPAETPLGRIFFPDAPAKPAAATPPGGDPHAVTSQLERHISSVRSYREQSATEKQSRRQRVDAGWGEVVTAMQALKARFAKDARVLGFAVSRDAREVSLKIADAYEKRGYRYFLLSREHPDGKYPGVDAVWLREFGRDDASFEEPKAAMEELFLRIAGSLA